MPYRCCVPDCRGNKNNLLKVKVYSFPKDEKLIKIWLQCLSMKNFQPKNSKVCEIHFKESDFVKEVSACNPRTGIAITFPLVNKRLKKGVVPSLFLPTSSLVISDEELAQQKKKSIAEPLIQNTLKGVPTENSELKDSSETVSPALRFPGKKTEESKEMVKRKRKATASETLNKKVDSLSKLNETHASNGVKAPEKPTEAANTKKAEKPVCTNPEAFAFLNVQVKQEPLSDGEIQNGSSKNNPASSSPENVQITNVRSLSSERSIVGSPEEENARKKQNEGFDSNFYTKPLDIDQRDKAFGGFVACELSDLRANPALYMKTKQSILKTLTEAHFEQMSSNKKS